MKYELVTFADKDSFSWGGHFDFLIGLNFQKSEDAQLFLHWWKGQGELDFKASLDHEASISAVPEEFHKQESQT